MRAMDMVDDPAEGSAAAAAVNIVRLISAAFGAGLAGVVINNVNNAHVGDGRGRVPSRPAGGIAEALYSVASSRTTPR